MNHFCYQIYKTSLEESLLKAGDKIIVSLSGGIDSLSLCCLLSDFREKIDLDLHWVHFNHGLRQESTQEEQFVQELSDQKKIPLTIIRTDQLKGQKGMQNKARKWRYDNLVRIRSELGFKQIALGHHLNDLIETQIWRMLRGGSLFSFNPMTMNNPPYIRPLLHTPKADLENYLKQSGQAWCEDASNADNDYTRNLIRNQLIPIMQTCAGGRLAEKLLALDADARLLKELFQQHIPRKRYQQETLPYSIIMEHPPLLAAELIHRYLLYHNQTEINRSHIELVYKQVKANLGNWTINLKEGTEILGKHKHIFIRKKILTTTKTNPSQRRGLIVRTFLFVLSIFMILSYSERLQAAYQNPVLKVLLFDASAGVYLYNPKSLTISNGKTLIGTGYKILITGDHRGLVINNTLHSNGNLRINGSGETRIKNLDTGRQRYYLGTFEVRPFKNGVHLINHIPTESYLEGVLNAEISTRWHMEVVKAQAVISRTFALFKREKRMQEPWHLSAGHHDQVYKGSEIADDRGRSAIRATSGIVVEYNGGLAQTFYHSNCGGTTADPINIWQSQLPYLKIRRVPFGKSDPRFNWKTVISNQELSRIMKRAGKPVGSLHHFKISRHTRSGRVSELTVEGRKRQKLSGYAFRKAGGYSRIQSLLFKVRRVPGGFEFKGTGNGHGVGLSQWSAKEMAEQGYQYHEILYYFYQGVRLMRHQG